jgi:ribosomal protein S14
MAIHEILEALRNLGVKKRMICSIAATAKAGGRVDIAERDFGLCRQEIRTLASEYTTVIGPAAETECFDKASASANN